MKAIHGYEGRYEISRDGRVFSLIGKRKELSPYVSNDYYNISLTDNTKTKRRYRIHRLVAGTYIDRDENRNVVDHIDGDKLNNNADNLRWCTDTENQEYRNKQGNDGGDKGHLGSNNLPILLAYRGGEYSSKNSLAKYLSEQRGVTQKCLVKTITNTLKRQGTLYGYPLSYS